MTTAGAAEPAAPDSRASSPLTALLRLLERPLANYYLVLGAGALLLVLGLLMVLSASSLLSFQETGSPFTIFQKQLIWVGIGLPIMWVASRLPVQTYRALAYPMLMAALVLLALVLVPGVGKEVNGNRNWIDLGSGMQIQPSEAAKLALVLWGADLLTRKAKLLNQWNHLLVPLVPGAAVVVGMVLFGGDLGTAIVLMAIVLALLFFAGAPMRMFGVMAGAMLGLALIMIRIDSERVSRVTGFLDPWSDYANSGWQAIHSIYALASGGWWGVGLGASRQKWDYLPEAHTDFIFAIIGEELGMFGTFVVLALFAALGFAGFRIAARTKDPFAALTAAAATAWLMVQMVVNIGAVIGVLPVTGIPLPLVSYGGSALLPTMAVLGMLLSFAKREPGARAALAVRGPGPIRRRFATSARGR